MFPTFAERGRNQIEMTRMIGRFAVDRGRTEATRSLGGLVTRAEGLLEEFGLRSDPEDQQPPAADVNRVEPEAAPTPPEPPTAGEGGADLAIPGYDSLAASQVIPRLAGLSDEESADIARYESSHRGRKTVLGKISQLQDA